jgi:hypothetical protein
MLKQWTARGMQFLSPLERNKLLLSLSREKTVQRPCLASFVIVTESLQRIASIATSLAYFRYFTNIDSTASF